ncbi:hypothetical protein TNCV_490391 [Trichonephila clavipes]|nr:hypothetical protein TNCV_490391 [Trichonephila clavipes]
MYGRILPFKYPALIVAGTALNNKSPERNFRTDFGSPPIPFRAFCMAKGDFFDISLLGNDKIKKREYLATSSMLGLGKTRHLPGHSSIGPTSAKHNFVLPCLHPPRRPTREAVCRSSGQNQARRLPGVHPEYNATASG